MTNHFDSDSLLEQRLRHARDAQSEHLRFTSPESGTPQREPRRLSPRAVAVAIALLLCFVALASLHAPMSVQADVDEALGISTSDLTRSAGALPVSESYDAQ